MFTQKNITLKKKTARSLRRSQKNQFLVATVLRQNIFDQNYFAKKK